MGRLGLVSWRLSFGDRQCGDWLVSVVFEVGGID